MPWRSDILAGRTGSSGQRQARSPRPPYSANPPSFTALRTAPAHRPAHLHALVTGKEGIVPYPRVFFKANAARSADFPVLRTRAARQTRAVLV